jgi:hypothetical protein
MLQTASQNHKTIALATPWFGSHPKLATDPELLAQAQRRSWVIEQMGPSHPEMTREQVAALVDEAMGPTSVDLIGSGA